MFGSVNETEYGKLLMRPREAGGVTMSTYCIVADPDAHFARRRPRAPRSRASRKRRTTADATTPARIPRATCGPSAPTIHGPGIEAHADPVRPPDRSRLTRCRSARIPTGSPGGAGGDAGEARHTACNATMPRGLAMSRRNGRSAAQDPCEKRRLEGPDNERSELCSRVSKRGARPLAAERSGCG